jgi:hypothetical protein
MSGKVGTLAGAAIWRGSSLCPAEDICLGIFALHLSALKH